MKEHSEFFYLLYVPSEATFSSFAVQLECNLSNLFFTASALLAHKMGRDDLLSSFITIFPKKFFNSNYFSIFLRIISIFKEHIG